VISGEPVNVFQQGSDSILVGRKEQTTILIYPEGVMAGHEFFERVRIHLRMDSLSVGSGDRILNLRTHEFDGLSFLR
jgi:hypothetical protein